MFMRKKQLFILLLFTCIIANAQVMWQFKKDTVVTWNYADGDEFNGDKVDEGKWIFSYGWGRSIYSQKEQQYYSEGKNHTIKNGLLSLHAKKEKVTEKIVDYINDSDSIIVGKTFYGLNKREFNYTAGLIQSKYDFLYGYFEIKFKLPKQNGYWPAFWLYGGTPNEEIDFMELKTNKPNQIHVGRHSTTSKENEYREFFAKKHWGAWVKFKGNLNEGYNIVAGEWTKDYVKYYLNGEIIAYTALSLNVPKKLVANIAVPSNNGPFKPGPNDTTLNSGGFDIDYIRVWVNKKNDLKKQLIPIDVSKLSETKYDLNTSKLKSKNKFIYGKKSIHKNEGITVSLIKLSNNSFQLVVLGKEIPADASFKIIDQKQVELKKENLVYGETTISYREFKNQTLFIEVTAYGKKIKYTLTN